MSYEEEDTCSMPMFAVVDAKCVLCFNTHRSLFCLLLKTIGLFCVSTIIVGLFYVLCCNNNRSLLPIQ